MKLAVTGAAVYSVPIIGRRESVEHWLRTEVSRSDQGAN